MSDVTISIPFAENGDRQTVPTPAQPSGGVSYEQGYTPQYSDPQSPQYVERTLFNEIIHTLSSHVKHLQDKGVDIYRADISYPLNAIVWHDGSIWQKKAAGSGAPAPGSATWGELNITMLAHLTGATFTGAVYGPTAPNQATAYINKQALDTELNSQFANTGAVIARQAVTQATNDSSTKIATTQFVKNQNYAAASTVTNLADKVLAIDPIQPRYEAPLGVTAYVGAGVREIFPGTANAMKPSMKRVTYLTQRPGDPYVPGQSEFATIAALFAAPGGDPGAVMLEFGREAQFIRCHVRLQADVLTDNRNYSQSYVCVSRIDQGVLTQKIATQPYVDDKETAILRTIKNFWAKTPAEFDRYNSDARFRLVTSVNNKNIRCVTDRSQVGTTIGSDDAVLVSHTHEVTRVVGAGSYPADGSADVGSVPSDGSWDYKKGRRVATSSAGSSGVGKNIPASFCMALFEFIG